MKWTDEAYEWHPWFAWRPITIQRDFEKPTFVWWEWIERRTRKGIFRGEYWEYRILETTTM